MSETEYISLTEFFDELTGLGARDLTNNPTSNLLLLSKKIEALERDNVQLWGIVDALRGRGD